MCRDAKLWVLNLKRWRGYQAQNARFYTSRTQGIMFSVDSPVRIPRGFEFLSGFADPVRGRRLIMPMQAFIDDSGGKGHGTHFVLAGFLSPAEKWFRFADEWRDCLAQAPRIQRFKMSEAKAINGEFHGLTDVERDNKLIALAEVINRNVELSIYSGLVLKDHEALLGGISKPLNEVYFWPFLSIIMGAAFDLADAGHKEKFEMVFDEQYIFGPRAKDWYPLIKEFAARSEPAAHAIMPADVMFGDDDEFLPLQAADLLAGCHRLNLSPDGENFDWLLARLTNVRTSPFSSIDNKESMQAMLNYALDRETPFSQELHEKCQVLLGKFRKNKKRTGLEPVVYWVGK